MCTRLVLYSRQWCHLCHEMEVALGPLQSEFGLELEVIDVDTDPGLVALYDEKVPVLMFRGQELCHHFLDEQAVRAVLCGSHSIRCIDEQNP